MKIERYSTSEKEFETISKWKLFCSTNAAKKKVYYLNRGLFSIIFHLICVCIWNSEQTLYTSRINPKDFIHFLLWYNVHIYTFWSIYYGEYYLFVCSHGSEPKLLLSFLLLHLCREWKGFFLCWNQFWLTKIPNGILNKVCGCQRDQKSTNSLSLSLWLYFKHSMWISSKNRKEKRWMRCLESISIVWFTKWLWVHTNFNQGMSSICVERLLTGVSIVHHNCVVRDKWAQKFNQIPFDILSTMCLLACNFMETQLKMCLSQQVYLI